MESQTGTASASQLYALFGKFFAAKKMHTDVVFTDMANG
jgi:hypothetical protein